MTGWLLDCLSPEQLLYWFLLLWLLVKVSDFEIRIISGGLVELVGPCVNDWIAVEVIDRGHEALLELLFGGDTDGCRRCNRLDARLLVVGDDRHRITRICAMRLGPSFSSFTVR